MIRPILAKSIFIISLYSLSQVWAGDEDVAAETTGLLRAGGGATQPLPARGEPSGRASAEVMRRGQARPSAQTVVTSDEAREENAAAAIGVSSVDSYRRMKRGDFDDVSIDDQRKYTIYRQRSDMFRRVNRTGLLVGCENAVGFIGVILAGGGSLVVAISVALPEDSPHRLPLSIAGAVLAGTGAIFSAAEIRLKVLVKDDRDLLNSLLTEKEEEIASLRGSGFVEGSA